MVGLAWLTVMPVELVLPIMALIIPQALISDEQMVIAAEPLALTPFKFAVEPLIEAKMTPEFELLYNVYVPVPPIIVIGTVSLKATVTLLWLNKIG